jgi:hypothetical protein
MNSFADEFNPDQTQTNPFTPHRYDQVADWIDSLSPDAVTKMGWHSTDEIWGAVNQAFSLYEGPPGAEEIQ